MLQCLVCEGSGCLSPRTKCVNASFCFEFINESSGTTDIRKGCFASQVHAQLQCDLNSTTESSKIMMRCCQTDFCNDQIVPPQMDPPSPSTNSFPTILPSIVASIVVIVLLVISFYFCKLKKKTTDTNNEIEKGMIDRDADDLLSETSGSGHGLPLLSPRTLSKEIQLSGRFYCGKSTEVWKGTWKGTPVAVKVFYTRDENLFKNELNVYESITKHQNILDVLTSDCTSIDCCTQQWLVTSFCELGSLFDYLSSTPIDQVQCLSFLFGIIKGLDYLHSADKPIQIAHRDLKSKNILVKNALNVCIADFGLSVSYNSETNKITNGSKYKVGTIRYMAPELLSDQFNGTNFESHKKADIYSFSLVTWEILRRCLDSNGKSDAYSLPYEGIVPSDPTFEDMAKVVCTDDQRPLINQRMLNDPVIAQVSKIMAECWASEPSKRLTSLRARKSLMKLGSKL